ncbi:MAG: hypothetical protein KAJ96_05540 [Candidatus Thorarchaeota archaeon]|nr:hypothetical protein [Candidatus Thorarchaeota archaeon]
MVLGKYRREEEDRRKKGESTAAISQPSHTSVEGVDKIGHVEAVPNRERKSPIVSFSIPIDLRSCLQAVRSEKSINLSMWVERKLREAVANEFPTIAERHLKT